MKATASAASHAVIRTLASFFPAHDKKVWSHMCIVITLCDHRRRRVQLNMDQEIEHGYVYLKFFKVCACVCVCVRIACTHTPRFGMWKHVCWRLPALDDVALAAYTLRALPLCVCVCVCVCHRTWIWQT